MVICSLFLCIQQLSFFLKILHIPYIDHLLVILKIFLRIFSLILNQIPHSLQWKIVTRNNQATIDTKIICSLFLCIQHIINILSSWFSSKNSPHSLVSVVRRFILFLILSFCIVFKMCCSVLKIFSRLEGIRDIVSFLNLYNGQVLPWKIKELPGTILDWPI